MWPCGGRDVAGSSQRGTRGLWQPLSEPRVRVSVSASGIVHAVKVSAFLGSGEAFTVREFSVQIPAVPSAVRGAAESPALHDDRRWHPRARRGAGAGYSLSRRCRGKKSCQTVGDSSYPCVSRMFPWRHCKAASTPPGQAGPVLRHRTPGHRGDVACVGFLDFAPR